MRNIKIAFVGGGKRMFYCAENLGKCGFECALYGFDAISDRASSTRCSSLYDCFINSSAVILPLPLTKDGININSIGSKIRMCDVFSHCPEGVPVFAGAVSEKARAIAGEYNREIYDYFDDDTLTEKNAYSTAEGALMLLMQNSEKTVFGTKVLVCGYGRIGKYTAKILKNLGAVVMVLARREVSRVQAVIDGHNAIQQEKLYESINTFDFILNTVPANIITEKELSQMSSNQIYIELASNPFGIDKKLADSYNIEVVDGSALPSRYCPESAGGYIAEKLMNEFERSGII